VLGEPVGREIPRANGAGQQPAMRARAPKPTAATAANLLRRGIIISEISRDIIIDIPEIGPARGLPLQGRGRRASCALLVAKKMGIEIGSREKLVANWAGHHHPRLLLSACKIF
jgi:hypothetical protein